MSYPEGLHGADYCALEGHVRNGGSECLRCEEMLRCGCGQYVREDKLEEHLREHCPMIKKQQP